MTDIPMDALVHAISALSIQRWIYLRALERGESVPGEDDDHLHDALIGIESALSTFREFYERQLDDSGMYPSYDELMNVGKD